MKYTKENHEKPPARYATGPRCDPGPPEYKTGVTATFGHKCVVVECYRDGVKAWGCLCGQCWTVVNTILSLGLPEIRGIC